MRLLFLFLSFLFITSCSTVGLDAYVEGYIRFAEGCGYSKQKDFPHVLIIREIDSKKDFREDTHVGECIMWYLTDVNTSYFREILIYKNMSEEQKLKVIIHELGHCVTLLDHTKNPNDIMYPWADYQDNMEHAMRDLCDQIRKRWQL